MRVYRFRLPPIIGLLLLIPLGLFLFSLIAVIVAAGLAGALILPFFLRRALRRAQHDPNTIELRPEDYRRIE
jgi:hypothetical protein